MIVGGIGEDLTFHEHTFEYSQVHAAESADVYISLSVAGGFPDIQGMTLAGREVSKNSVSDSVGGGFKVGIFPQATRRALGVELEYFGTTGRLSTLTSSNGIETEGTAGLTVLNSMFNIILRQPSGALRPYGGVGIGYSGGILHGADFPDRSNRDFDSTTNFAYQFMGGLQWEVRGRTFVFAEYKYLATDLHWKGMSLDYRASYVLAGFGWSF